MSANAEDFLSEYPDRHTLARRWGISWHTVYRYELEPDGLPNMMLGGRKRPWKDACAWLERRVKRPNPRRGAK